MMLEVSRNVDTKQDGEQKDWARLFYSLSNKQFRRCLVTTDLKRLKDTICLELKLRAFNNDAVPFESVELEVKYEQQSNRAILRERKG